MQSYSFIIGSLVYEVEYEPTNEVDEEATVEISHVVRHSTHYLDARHTCSLEEFLDSEDGGYFCPFEDADLDEKRAALIATVVAHEATRQSLDRDEAREYRRSGFGRSYWGED